MPTPAARGAPQPAGLTHRNEAEPRTFSDVLPWEGFLSRSRDLFNGLDNTERKYQRPNLVSSILPCNSIAPAAEAEVRGCIVRMFRSINTTAEILGIPMEYCSGGDGRTMSFTDLLVRPAGARSDSKAQSSQVFRAIEVKGDWEFQLERGERLEDALNDPERIEGIVQAIQHVYGDAVLDEAPLLVLTNYHVTIFMRCSHDVQDKRLWASEPIWFDHTDPPARACWVHALQQAEELRKLKQRLPRATVPPTIQGYHIEPRPQQAGEPSSSGRPLKQRRTTSASSGLHARSPGKRYKETKTYFSAEAQPATAGPSHPEIEEMVSLSELNLTDELQGAGQFGYTFKGSRQGRPVAVKVYNLQKYGAAATCEQERLAYKALKSLQGRVIPHLLCSGLLQHTAAPVIVTSLEGNAMEEDERVPTRLHAPMRKALQAFHATGAAHGDVRLSNFLVGDDGKVWLIDLGQSVLQASKARMDAEKHGLKEILSY